MSSWLYKNLANMVTSAGFPLGAIFLHEHLCKDRIWELVWLFLAFFTDVLDGRVAEWLGIKSVFGGNLDRARDKYLIAIVIFAIVFDGNIDLSLKLATIPVAIIEVLLTSYLIAGWVRRIDASTVKRKNGRGFGQWKMGIFSVAVLLCFLNLVIEERWTNAYHVWTTGFIDFLVIASIPLAIASLVNHRAKYNKQISAT